MILQHETEQTHFAVRHISPSQSVLVTQIHRATQAARGFEPSLKSMVVNVMANG